MNDSRCSTCVRRGHLRAACESAGETPRVEIRDIPAVGEILARWQKLYLKRVALLEVGVPVINTTCVKLLGDDGCGAETSGVSHRWHRGPCAVKALDGTRSRITASAAADHVDASSDCCGSCAVASMLHGWLCFPDFRQRVKNFRRNGADHNQQSRHTRTRDRQPPQQQLQSGAQTSDAMTAILSEAGQSTRLNL